MNDKKKYSRIWIKTKSKSYPIQESETHNRISRVTDKYLLLWISFFFISYVPLQSEKNI